MDLDPSEQQRRDYWADQMELGHALVEQLLAFPVQECGEAFASIPAAVDEAGVEVLFSNSKIAGNLDRVFQIRRSLIPDILTIAESMNRRGWVLKIEDGYRSLEMQSQLVRKPAVFDSIVSKCRWECGGEQPPVDLVARRGVVLVANYPKIGTHMSGSAIDISVFRRDGTEVWRGGPYLEMSERTPMRSPFISADELRNRLEITEIMEAAGFMHFPYEFWHYNKGDAGAQILTGRSEPARFGPVHWNSADNTVTPVAEPLQPLNPLPVIEREIAAALARAAQ
ncbi:MAG: hypothetical protein KDA85_00625 [Planctomycetaceae bacterium]|nr:hypothetical protein [Planctomycetaceae bacterium]